MQGKIQEHTQQAHLINAGLAELLRQLNPSEQAPPLSPSELNEKLEAAQSIYLGLKGLMKEVENGAALVDDGVSAPGMGALLTSMQASNEIHAKILKQASILSQSHKVIHFFIRPPQCQP